MNFIEDINKGEEDWTIEIKPKKRLLDIDLKGIWKYRDLYYMYVKRDIITVYKQTILGPLWFLIQPMLTTVMYMFVFGGLAGISTDGIPQPLFYMSGILLWNYFNAAFVGSSNVFTANASVFGKVYFPRLVVPLSIVISCMIKMGIQFGLFVLIYIYYLCNGYSLMVNGYAWLAPLLLLMLAGLGLGFGLLISSLTTKYRDLRFLITFGVQLWMYATPVIYPLSVMRQSHEQYMWIIVANPLTSLIETFKFGFLGVGTFSWFHLGYTLVFTVVIMLWGMVTFNRVQRSFMDVI